MQPKKVVLVPAVLFLSLAAAGARAQVVTETLQITSEGAKAMIDACASYAEEHGMNLALWVVDQTGTPIRFKRMQGASTIAVDTAFRKAVSARMYGMPTNPEEPLVDRFLTTEQGRQFFTQIEFWPSQGGHPIRVNGQVIGAIGVGGIRPVAGVSQDELCAQAALEEVFPESLQTD